MRSFFMTILASAPAAEGVTNNLVEVPEGFWERFLFGLQFSGIGIIVVFIVLIILMIVVKIFEKIFYSKKQASAEPVAAPAAEPAVTAAPAVANDDAMMAAVIAAAVDAYYDNVQAQANVPAQSRKKYQIRSFRRI